MVMLTMPLCVEEDTISRELNHWEIWTVEMNDKNENGDAEEVAHDYALPSAGRVIKQNDLTLNLTPENRL